MYTIYFCTHTHTQDSELASVSGQQSSGPTAHSSNSLAPPVSGPAAVGGGEIEAHKRRIAKAVDHVREQRHLWQHQSRANRHIKEIVTDSETKVGVVKHEGCGHVRWVWSGSACIES